MGTPASDEAELYESIKAIVIREVGRLSKVSQLEPGEFRTLEQLAKIYAILKDDLRDDMKAGLLGKD